MLYRHTVDIRYYTCVFTIIVYKRVYALCIGKAREGEA